MEKRQQEIADRLCKMLVEDIHLPMKKEDIKYEAPLFAGGLGLDSLDVLELAGEIEDEYGVVLTEEHREHFETISKLSEYIMKCLDEIEE